MKPPRTRYARSGDLNIAYQQFGAGDLDIVWAPGFVTHLDLAWDTPVWTHLSRRLGSFARVTLFDKRGTGLSDRGDVNVAVDERMDDIRAVMDDAGIERAALIGYSEGGPISMLFAATYPERVAALVLGATFAQPMEMPDLEDRLQEVEKYWGSGHVLRFFVPYLDLDFAARYERSSATPRGAAEILRTNAGMDVRAALPAITAPTLVIHRTGDPIVPVDHARHVARAIAGARYIEYGGDTHEATTIEEWTPELDAIEEFLTGSRPVASPDRVLATVLFTDIVASTERAAAMGDAAWRIAVERHEAETAHTIAEFRGRRVKSTGDGVVATFDGPARAIRCAAAIAERAAAAGLPIRAGLHAGEIELLRDDIAGIAVHLAKRVESAATPGRVWVSQTVRDLVTGSGIELDDRGVHDLKGVPGEWRLFEVVAV